MNNSISPEKNSSISPATNIPTSFIEAVQKYQPQPRKGHAFMLGRKIYLGFDDKTGWKVHEITIFGQILRQFGLAYRNTHRKHILQNLEKINFTEKETKIFYNSTTAHSLYYNNTSAYFFFSKAIKAKTADQTDISPQLPNQRPSFVLKNSEEASIMVLPENLESPPATTPLFLFNYDNSCYLDSTMEMMLSHDFIRKKIFNEYTELVHKHSQISEELLRISKEEIPKISKECETEDTAKNESAKLAKEGLQKKARELQNQANDLEKKLSILKELRNLILLVEKTGKGNRAPIGYGSPAEKVRQAIFASELHGELTGNDRIKEQQDAGDALLVFNEILNNEIQTITVHTGIKKENGEKIASKETTSKSYKLELCFEANVDMYIDRRIFSIVQNLLKDHLITKNYFQEKDNYEHIKVGIETILASLEKLEEKNDQLKMRMKNCLEVVNANLKKLTDQQKLRDQLINRLLLILPKKKNSKEDFTDLIALLNQVKSNPKDAIDNDVLESVSEQLKALLEILDVERPVKPLEFKDMVDQYFKPIKAETGTGESETLQFTLESGAKENLPHINQAKLLQLPDSFPFHIKRFEFNEAKHKSEKLNDPISLPKDGIVDMAPYFSQKRDKPCQYEITGYVVHHGASLSNGHYTSNVKIGDRFYHCNDFSQQLHVEITKEEFYGNTEAYLVMLKKIPDEPAAEAPNLTGTKGV